MANEGAEIKVAEIVTVATQSNIILEQVKLPLIIRDAEIGSLVKLHI